MGQNDIEVWVKRYVGGLLLKCHHVLNGLWQSSTFVVICNVNVNVIIHKWKTSEVINLYGYMCTL